MRIITYCVVFWAEVAVISKWIGTVKLVQVLLGILVLQVWATNRKNKKSNLCWTSTTAQGTVLGAVAIGQDVAGRLTWLCFDLGHFGRWATRLIVSLENDQKCQFYLSKRFRCRHLDVTATTISLCLLWSRLQCSDNERLFGNVWSHCSQANGCISSSSASSASASSNSVLLLSVLLLGRAGHLDSCFWQGCGWRKVFGQ